MNLKEGIAEQLELRRGTPMSGQELADMFGVTRAAVWKAVKGLEKDGYSIEAAGNRGYMLADGNDVLSRRAIELCLSDELGPLEVEVFRTIDSTNSEAKRRVSCGEPRECLIVANEQTAGRGRRGRSFFSPMDTGLYMSVVLCPKGQLADSLLVTVAAAVAVCRVIERLCSAKTGIKWVNDIFIDGKKVCGILSEGVSDLESGSAQAIIVGIGVNVTTASFPDDIKHIAGAVMSGKGLRNRLAAEITNELFSLCRRLDDPCLIKEYKERSLVVGRLVTFRRGELSFEAEAVDINSDGNLIVKRKDGSIETLSAGEITIGSESIV